MENRNLDIEALDTLIQAVNIYQNELNTNKQILVNAANVCDAAMGSDEIAQKQIARLNSALVKLEATAQLAAEVAAALISDKQHAMDVVNNS